jgi:glycosyltransferase involved in cell wall biosynthesis
VRVIIVCNDLEIGGAERQALILARYLAERAEVEIWGLEGPGPLAALCAEDGIPWHVAHFTYPTTTRELLRGLPRFAGALRRAKPDVLLPYTIFPNVVCGLLWRWVGARACVWNQRDEGVTRMGPRAEQLAIRQVRRFIANSEQGARFLTDTLKVRRGRIHVVRNGVDPPRPGGDRVQARRQLALPDDGFVVCMIANLSRFKDHLELLRAWRVAVGRLARTGRAPVLLLVGRLESGYPALASYIQDSDLAQTVRFLGYVPDVSPVLSAADLGIFSSRSEGCPNGVLECMVAGLPVVGTDIAGIREAVGMSGHRFLSPPGDPDAMAERIVELAADPELRRNMGLVNQERVQNEFGATRMCESTMSVIAQAWN